MSEDVHWIEVRYETYYGYPCYRVNIVCTKLEHGEELAKMSYYEDALLFANVKAERLNIKVMDNVAGNQKNFYRKAYVHKVKCDE